MMEHPTVRDQVEQAIGGDAEDTTALIRRMADEIDRLNRERTMRSIAWRP